MLSKIKMFLFLVAFSIVVTCVYIMLLSGGKKVIKCRTKNGTLGKMFGVNMAR